MSIESSPSPSPYKGATGSISSARASRLRVETISRASSSSSAVRALPSSAPLASLFIAWLSGYLCGIFRENPIISACCEAESAAYVLRRQIPPQLLQPLEGHRVGGLQLLREQGHPQFLDRPAEIVQARVRLP